MHHTLTITPQSPLARDIDALFGATSNPNNPIRHLFSCSTKAEIGYGTIYHFTPQTYPKNDVETAIQQLQNYPAFLTAILEAIAAKKIGLEVDVPNNYSIVQHPKQAPSSHDHMNTMAELIAWFSK